MKKRIFNIMQFEYHPDNAYDEDGNLIPGAEPLFSQKQIEDGLRHRVFKRWAYIWHDKDVYTEEDEKKNPRHRAGETKPRHAHVVAQCDDAIEVSDVARWFGVPENFIDLPSGRGAFLDCVRYLTHEDEKQQALGKTLYHDDAVVANFDWRDAVDKYVEGRMKPTERMRMNVLRNGWSLKQCREEDPLTYSKIRSSLPPLRLDYLMDEEPCPFRITIYVDGKGGTGKSAYCRYIAQTLFQGVDDPYFVVGNDERVTFDGYDGQPILIWDDWRVTDFINRFKPQGTYRILDPHPDKHAEQAKHSRVVLTNAVNIINGVQPYDEFIAGLAGTYTNKRTGVHYEAEDDTQAWRRFPMILCVHEDDFDVLLNEGFVNNDMSAIKTMRMYANVRCSFKNIMHHLEGDAKAQVLKKVSKPVLEAVDKVKESQDCKISDPAQIPPEFADYGKVMTDEEVKQLREDKFLDEAEDYETRRFEALLDFVSTFWRETMTRFPSAAYDPLTQLKLADELNVRNALERYIDGELVKTYPMDEIMRVVKGWWREHHHRFAEEDISGVDVDWEAILENEKHSTTDALDELYGTRSEDGDGSLGE